MDELGEGQLEHEVALRLVTENMQDMIVQIDARGIRQYVSQSVKPVLGYEPSELVGKPVFDLIHPDDMPMVMNVLSRGVKGPMHGILETRHLHADGHYIWLETTGNTIEDEGGDIVGGIVVSRNVDARKKVEEELIVLNRKLEERVVERTAQLEKANRDLANHLREVEEAWEAVRKSEEYYHMIMENAGETIMVVDVESRKIIDCNHQATLMSGMAYEEILGKELQQLRPLQTTEIGPYIEEVLRLRNVSIREIKASDLKGREAWGEYSGCVYEIDGRELMVVMVRDITRRKREELRWLGIEKRRREQEESDFLLMRLDLEGNIVYLNECARLFSNGTDDRSKKGPALGTVIMDSAENRHSLEKLLLEIIRSPEEKPRVELECVCAAGGARWIEWTARAVHDEKGHVAEASLTGLDVTERRRREDELLSNLEQLRRKLESDLG